MISFNTTPLKLWNGKAQSRPSGKQLLIRESYARRPYRVMWHNCPGQCSRPIGMKKLSYKHKCKLAPRLCYTLLTGHKQRFIHTHVTRSPPIGIAINCLRY